MALFTPVTAKENALKSVASRMANGWKAKSKYLISVTPSELNEEHARDRISRLWECLSLIDSRVKHELGKEKPNGQLLKDLAATARSLRDQAEAPATNGHTKRQPAAQAPDLPEPTV